MYYKFHKGWTLAHRCKENYGVSNKKELSLKFCKSLYGLEQASRICGQLLHAYLLNAGFAQCVEDMCLYWKREAKDIVVVGVHVYNLLVTETERLRSTNFCKPCNSVNKENSAK